jgi:hypothetical protein
LSRFIRTRDPAAAVRAVDPTVRRLWVNALQSRVFNRVVAARCAAIDRLLDGDVAFKHENGACFSVADAASEHREPTCSISVHAAHGRHRHATTRRRCRGDRSGGGRRIGPFRRNARRQRPGPAPRASAAAARPTHRRGRRKRCRRRRALHPVGLHLAARRVRHSAVARVDEERRDRRGGTRDAVDSA